MVKFKTAKLNDGTLTVGGPSMPSPGMRVKHLRFMIAQGSVMVEDDARVSGNAWSGQTAARGLKPGLAHGFGLAVMFKPRSPSSFETVTWVEQVKLTK